MNIPAPNVMLLGEPGSGKTWAIRSLIAAGVETFVFALDSQTVRKLADQPKELCHVMYIPPMSITIGELVARASRMKDETWNALKARTTDDKKAEYSQAYYQLLCGIQDFVDSNTGESFGDVSERGNDCAIVIDHLTAFAQMTKGFVVGNPPFVSQSMIGSIQESISNTIGMITHLKPLLVIIAHVKRQYSEQDQLELKMPLTIGRALGTTLNQHFDEVIYATRRKGEFIWSTDESDVNCKASYLPVANKLKPDFGLVTEAWKKFSQQEVNI